MKIENSNVLMESNLQVQKEHSSSIVKYEVQHNFLAQVEANAQKAHTATKLLLSTDFRSEKTIYQRAIYSHENQMCSKEKLNKHVIENIIGMFFESDKESFNYPQKQIDEESLKNSAILIETREEYYQKQTIDFQSYVEIETSNEKYIIDLEVSFSQELYEAHSMELKLGNQNLIDPLVINYGDDTNPFDNISKLKFEFDLNSDGKNELIPLLKQGAGFLAYDKNENGEIDNGSELFGPQTNDAFKELATYDQDNNNWIDENDAVFNKLKVWQVNEEGQNKLVSLIDLNIGAIYLGEVKSGFSYQNKIDKVDAIQRTNGIYVKNDGSGIRMINALDIALENSI
jgi:hypothetical protein